MIYTYAVVHRSNMIYVQQIGYKYKTSAKNEAVRRSDRGKNSPLEGIFCLCTVVPQPPGGVVVYEAKQ